MSINGLYNKFLKLMLPLLLTNCGSQNESELNKNQSSDAVAAFSCQIDPTDKTYEIESEEVIPKSPATGPKTPVDEDEYYDLVQQTRKIPGNTLKLEYKERTSSLCEIILKDSIDYLVLHLVPEDCSDCSADIIETQKTLDAALKIKHLAITSTGFFDHKPAQTLDIAHDAEGIFKTFFKVETEYKVLVMNKYSEGYLSLPETMQSDFESFRTE